MTPLLSLKQTCLDGSEIAGGNEASAFAPAVSSSTERFVPCCLPLLVLQMGAIVPCCLPRPDWRPRRCPPPMVKPLVAPRRTLVRFASRSSHLRLARTWMRNGRTRLRTVGGIPLPSLTRPPGLGRRRRRIYSGPSISSTDWIAGTGRILRSGRAIARRQSMCGLVSQALQSSRRRRTW